MWGLAAMPAPISFGASARRAFPFKELRHFRLRFFSANRLAVRFKELRCRRGFVSRGPDGLSELLTQRSLAPCQSPDITGPAIRVFAMGRGGMASKHEGAAGELLRILGIGFGLAVVVGGVVGQGIMRTPGIVAGAMPSEAWNLAAWTLGGLIILADACGTVELGA